MSEGPKDKVQKCDQSGLVYHVSCADCQATYIGETERPLGTRLKELEDEFPDR